MSSVATLLSVEICHQSPQFFRRNSYSILVINNKKKKKMGDFIEPGTHRSTNIKVKIETVEKIRNVF